MEALFAAIGDRLHRMREAPFLADIGVRVLVERSSLRRSGASRSRARLEPGEERRVGLPRDPLPEQRDLFRLYMSLGLWVSSGCQGSPSARRTRTARGGGEQRHGHHGPRVAASRAVDSTLHPTLGIPRRNGTFRCILHIADHITARERGARKEAPVGPSRARGPVIPSAPATPLRERPGRPARHALHGPADAALLLVSGSPSSSRPEDPPPRGETRKAQAADRPGGDDPLPRPDRRPGKPSFSGSGSPAERERPPLATLWARRSRSSSPASRCRSPSVLHFPAPAPAAARRRHARAVVGAASPWRFSRRPPSPAPALEASAQWTPALALWALGILVPLGAIVSSATHSFVRPCWTGRGRRAWTG